MDDHLRGICAASVRHLSPYQVRNLIFSLLHMVVRSLKGAKRALGMLALYNVLKERRFLRYIVETKNYPLLFLPMTYQAIVSQDEKVGFTSKILGKVMIAIWVDPENRQKGIAKEHIRSNPGWFLTSKPAEACRKAGAQLAVNIPYFRLAKLPKEPSKPKEPTQ